MSNERSVTKTVVSALLFDSDGVLVDSHMEGYRAWMQLSDEFGFELDDQTFDGLVGVRPTDSLVRFVNPDRHVEATARLEDIELEGASGTPGLPGARELLSGLPSGRWAIATSAGIRLAKARWEGAGIPIPDVVISSEDVAKGKPHPDPYLAAAASIGVDAANCLVFEDSSAGGQAGLAAGATVVAVGTQRWEREPSYRVASLADVAVSVTETGQLLVTLKQSPLPR